MLNKLRGAIIGCGYFGQIQMEAWRRMPDVEIAAACDPAPGKAATVAPQAYSDAAAMLDAERLDFIDIATRPDSHLSLIRLALDRKIPVIVQKPLAPTWELALTLAREVEASGVRVMPHENWRWQPWFREVARLVKVGELGQIFGYRFEMCQADGLGVNPYPNQPYFKEMPRLIMFESLIHPIDTARFIAGEIREVYAQTSRKNPVVCGEDRALIVMTHEPGVEGIVEGHRYLNPLTPGPAMGVTEILGERGRLTVLATGDIYRDGSLVRPNTCDTGYKGDSVFATQRHFIDCLRTGDRFEMDIAGYLPSIAAMEAAYVSAAEGRRVPVSELFGRNAVE